MNSTYLLLIFYFLVLITHIVFTSLIHEIVTEFITKILLVPLISATLYHYLPVIETKIYLVGLFFCWVGDIVMELIFDWTFYVGLGSFLIAHILFIITHLRIPNDRKQRLITISLVISIIVCVVVNILLFVLGSSIIVSFIAAIYFSVLVFMACVAYNVGTYSLIGGLCFVVSDTLIGVREFVLVTPYAWISGLVMAFYGLSLFFLVFGLALYIRRSQGLPNVSSGKKSSGTPFYPLDPMTNETEIIV